MDRRRQERQHPRLRFVDAIGQTFQPHGPKMTWRDDRYIRFPLDGTTAGHWGGANDRSVKIELATLIYEE